MSNFEDRVRNILNSGKSISVELPNDTFILDLLVELEDNESHHISISNDITLLYRESSFTEKFRYAKMGSFEDISQNNIDTFTLSRAKIKEVECEVYCFPKKIMIFPMTGQSCDDTIETILDYLGDDLLDYKREPINGGMLIRITYKSYEVYEREV